MQGNCKSLMVHHKIFAAALLLTISIASPSARSQNLSTDAEKPATPAKAPALVDTAGPDVSLQNSEALFDIAVALNSCGYDQGLDASDPIRQQVRDQVNQSLRTS